MNKTPIMDFVGGRKGPENEFNPPMGDFFKDMNIDLNNLILKVSLHKPCSYMGFL